MAARRWRGCHQARLRIDHSHLELSKNGCSGCPQILLGLSMHRCNPGCRNLRTRKATERVWNPVRGKKAEHFRRTLQAVSVDPKGELTERDKVRQEARLFMTWIAAAVGNPTCTCTRDQVRARELLHVLDDFL